MASLSPSSNSIFPSMQTLAPANPLSNGLDLTRMAAGPVPFAPMPLSSTPPVSILAPLQQDTFGMPSESSITKSQPITTRKEYQTPSGSKFYTKTTVSESEGTLSEKDMQYLINKTLNSMDQPSQSLFSDDLFSKVDSAFKSFLR